MTWFFSESQVYPQNIKSKDEFFYLVKEWDNQLTLQSENGLSIKFNKIGTMPSEGTFLVIPRVNLTASFFKQNKGRFKFKT